LNFDDWPDGWQRRSDREHPDYLRVGLRMEHQELAELLDQVERSWWTLWNSSPAARPGDAQPLWHPSGISLADRWLDRQLWMEIDAGEVELTGPLVPVQNVSSYRLSAVAGCERLVHSALWVELQFLSAEAEVVASEVSPSLSGDVTAQRLSIGPVTPPANARSGRLRIHVASRDGRRDVRASAHVDSLRLEQLPQLSLRADQSDGVYRLGQQPQFVCRVSGLSVAEQQVQFELTDPFGAPVDRQRVALDGEPAGRGISVVGAAQWQPVIPSAGFYRCRASFQDDAGRPIGVEQTILVVDELPQGPPDLYGWSLAGGHLPFSRRQLPAWLQHFHLAWIKYPCWVDSSNRQDTEELAWLLERLQHHQMQCVGVLDRPPTAQREVLGVGTNHDAASLFRDARLWQPLLEPILTRLSMRMQWWQIGGDDDHSFVGHPQLAQTIANIREQLQGFGQPISIAMPWSWNERPPDVAGAEGLRAISLSAREPLSPAELADFGQAFTESLHDDRQLWVRLEPLPQSRYPLATRVQDLVRQMIVVRDQPRIGAAFVPHPFDAERGLLQPDGSPNELLASFRTTATLLSGLRYAGRLQLPGGSPNAVLSDQNRAVVVLWNHRPVDEWMYLGDNVEVIDAWGRRQKVVTEFDGGRPRQRFTVDRWPQFVVGVDPLVAQWQLSIEVEPKRLDSLLGQPQELTVSIGNQSSGTFAGRVAFYLPESWQAPNTFRDLLLEAGQPARESLSVMLRSDAQAGVTPLRIDLQLEGEKSYQFSVWRDIEVGPEDVEIQLSAELNGLGQLVVRQEIVSHSSQTQIYDCLLFAPGRQRQRAEVLLPPGSRVHRTYLWANGDQLVGREIWLRAEQLGTARVLNYRQVVDGR
jgi:hypothetical protein